MPRWKVELYNPHLQDWRTNKVREPTEAAARASGLENESEGWEVDDIHPLCDFCEVNDEPYVEGTTRIVVMDPTDVKDDPERSEAPPRIAWVCDKHHEIVQGLQTA